MLDTIVTRKILGVAQVFFHRAGENWPHRREISDVLSFHLHQASNSCQI